MTMEISTYSKENNTIISIQGRLDTITSSELEEWLMMNFTPPAGKAVLDCSKIDYISSAGLRIILNMMKMMKKHAFAFSICCPHEHIKEVFDISGFATLIPVYRALDDCLQQSKPI